MEVLSFIDAISNETSCSLFDVDPESTLELIRVKLLEEVTELMPKDFVFLCSGVPISTVQERRLPVKKVASISSDCSDLIIKYKAVPQDQKLSEDKVDDADVSVLFDDSDTGLTKTKEEGEASDKVVSPQSKTYFLGLKSPTSCSVKGIKTYTASEIGDAVGREKERRLFWNKRAKALANFTDLKKNDIYRKIHEDWRQHKTELLLGEAKGLKVKPGGLKEGTLDKNTERVNNIKKEIENLTKEIKDIQQKGNADANALKDLRSKLASSRSDLRKAQDALRKSLAKSKQK